MNKLNRFFFFLLCFAHLNCLNAAYEQKYIWNLGLAMLCDVTPFKDGQLTLNFATLPTPNYALAQNYVNDVKEGDVIWVQTHQVHDFYTNVLPKIKNRFILLINDGDASFPSQYRWFDVDGLINDERVIHIFSQNVDTPGYLGKVSSMPIGIDFHTIAHCRNCWYFGEPQQSVEKQEEKLDQLLATLLPTDQRLSRAYVDFQIYDRGVFDGESRRSIFSIIYPTGLIDAASQRVARQELWSIKGQYAFSVSPRGAGMDCHRTWEDLVLGCIVIVKTSPLDCLYEGLPVVIVKDWREITRENLDKWLIQYGDAFTNPNYREKLTTQYWMNVIRSKKPIE